MAESDVSCRHGWCIANRTMVFGLGYKVGPLTQTQKQNPRLSERACALAGEAETFASNW